VTRFRLPHDVQHATRHLRSVEFYRANAVFFIFVLGLGGFFGSYLLLMVVAPTFATQLIPAFEPVAADFSSAASTAGVFWLTFLGGVYASTLALARLWREQQIGIWIDEKANASRDMLAHDRSVGWQIPGMESHFLTQVSNAPASRMAASTHGRIVRAIEADARDLRFEPVPVVVERVMDEVTRGTAEIKVWQHYAVRLGILFTFIGLILALGPLQEMLNQANAQKGVPGFTSQIQGQVAKVVENLALAFGASVSGLVAALVLQIAHGKVRERERSLVENLASRVSTLQFLARRVRSDNTLLHDIDALRHELGTHREELSHSSRTLQADIAALVTRVADVSSTRTALVDMLEKQRLAVERNETLARSLADADNRLKTLFDERLAQAEAAGRESARITMDGMRALGEAVIREIRSGYGSEARKKLEELLAERFERAASALENAGSARMRAIDVMARRLVVGVGLSVFVLLVAGLSAAVYFGSFITSR
jgi:hypothetical protein